MPEASTSIIIRQADQADISAVIALEQQIPTAAHWQRELYEAIFQPGPQRALLVAQGPQAIHGFLVARQVGSEWEIENIAVDASMRRQRLGARLLDDFLASTRAERAETVLLEVRESNIGARAFYERMGFDQTGRRTAYFSGPAEDAIIYRLRLP